MSTFCTHYDTENTLTLTILSNTEYKNNIDENQSHVLEHIQIVIQRVWDDCKAPSNPLSQLSGTVPHLIVTWLPLSNDTTQQ